MVSRAGEIDLPTDGFFHTGYQLFFCDADLLSGISVAEGNCAIFQSVKVYRDAERCTNFIHTAIATANCSGDVPEDIPAAAKFIVEPTCFFQKFRFVFYQREDRSLNRGNTWV